METEEHAGPFARGEDYVGVILVEAWVVQCWIGRWIPHG